MKFKETKRSRVIRDLLSFPNNNITNKYFSKTRQNLRLAFCLVISKYNLADFALFRGGANKKLSMSSKSPMIAQCFHLYVFGVYRLAPSNTKEAPDGNVINYIKCVD